MKKGVSSAAHTRARVILSAPPPRRCAVVFSKVLLDPFIFETSWSIISWLDEPFSPNVGAVDSKVCPFLISKKIFLWWQIHFDVYSECRLSSWNVTTEPDPVQWDAARGGAGYWPEDPIPQPRGHDGGAAAQRVGVQPEATKGWELPPGQWHGRRGKRQC